MTAVLVWKIYREHFLIWLAMALLAVSAPVLNLLLQGPDWVGQAALFCVIVCTYGLVVGAMLLAGEREAGTEDFLDALPAERLAIWRVKCVAGSVLVLSLVLFLWLLLLVQGAFRHVLVAVGILGALVVFAGLGFAWGLFFSARTRTPMGAVLAGVVGLMATLPLVVGLWALGLVLMPELLRGPGELFLLLVLSLLVVPGLLVVSGVREARLDRLRRLEPDQAVPRRFGRSLALPKQLLALLWLDLRQASPLFKWLAIGGLAAGMLLPLGVLVWPAVTLLLGVIAGVSVFADEQAEGAGRFLSEQRLPPGQVWAVKVGVRLCLTVGVALMVLIPAVSRLALLSLRRVGRDNGPVTDFDELVPLLQLGPYLTLYPGYGFSIGCLCGLLFPKRVVAGMVAVSMSLLVVTLWSPSLLVGGLHGWQIWGAPVLLLLTLRLLLWPWETGQLASVDGLLRLSGGLTLAGLWLAGAIAYRVVEVPLVADSLDLEGFERVVATDRKNEAGPRIRKALEQIADLIYKGEKRPSRPLFPAEELGKEAIPLTFPAQLNAVVSRGWPAQEPELGGWLDEAFRQPWAGELAAAVQMPPGIVEDLENQTLWTPVRTSSYTSLAAELLVARGLQRQAHGDPAVFVDNLATGLALVRQVRHREPTIVVQLAGSAEWVLLTGVERWLERLEKHPELLRRALDLLLAHEQAGTRDAGDHLRADYLVAMNTVRKPELWVGQYLGRGDNRELLAPMVALAWRTPWEQARLQRLVRLLANQPGEAFAVPQPLARFADLRADTEWRQRKWTEQKRSLLAHELMVALRLYQTETGQPAKTLQELTPKILPSLPADPETGKPFDYRISRGEEIPDSQSLTGVRKVQAGQWVLSSGGQVFLVPLPPGRAAR